MEKKNEKPTFGHIVHMLISIIAGINIFVVVLFLPLYSRLYLHLDNQDLQFSDFLLLALATFLIFGFKSFGSIANQIGKTIINVIKKTGSQ